MMLLKSTAPALLALSLLPGAALAQSETQAYPILRCQAGVGCWQRASQIDTEGARVLLGKPGVNSRVYIEGQPDPVDSPLTPQEVAATYGVPLYNDPTDLGPFENKPPYELFKDPNTGELKEIDLFGQDEDADKADAPENTSGGGALVPKDGMWRVSPAGQDFAGCNPGIAQMLQSGGLANVPEVTREITWGGRFDPAQTNFMNAEGQRLEWTQVSPTRFEGKLFAVRNDAAEVSTDVAMELVTPEHIKTSSVLNIASMIGDMAGAAEMAALGMLDCTITMHFDMKLVQ